MGKVKHLYYINKSNYYKNGFHHSDLLPECFVTDKEIYTGVYLPVMVILDAPPATIKLDESSVRKMLKEYATNLADMDDMEDATKEVLIKYGLIEDDYDPTPWCHVCGSFTQSGCNCGAIAENN